MPKSSSRRSMVAANLYCQQTCCEITSSCGQPGTVNSRNHFTNNTGVPLTTSSGERLSSKAAYNAHAVTCSCSTIWQRARGRTFQSSTCSSNIRFGLKKTGLSRTLQTNLQESPYKG